MTQAINYEVVKSDIMYNIEAPINKYRLGANMIIKIDTINNINDIDVIVCIIIHDNDFNKDLKNIYLCIFNDNDFLKDMYDNEELYFEQLDKDIEVNGEYHFNLVFEQIENIINKLRFNFISCEFEKRD